VDAVQQRQGLYISCLEEIAWRSGMITLEQLREQGEKMGNTEYGRYILRIADSAEKGVRL